MKRSLLFFLLIYVSIVQIQAQTIRYVAANTVGNGDGLSTGNAADFLNTSFWSSVQTLLATQPVTVKFLSGNYSRAISETYLSITNMGNAEHKLVLEGTSTTNFTLPTGYPLRSQVVKISNSQNVTVRNLHFSGNASTNYILNITTPEGSGDTTRNILIENCTWTDTRGVVYGAAGATLPGTYNITFKNCTFKRVGLNAGSHMIYNAYSSHHISVIDCHFEDGPGDYVRFRDKCDYAMVKGCTFVHPQNIPSIKFIALPLYNDGVPTIGNESFATNYAFTHNSFSSVTSNVTALSITNSGYSAVGYDYLLTASEGAILTGGTNAQKKSLMENNFGLFPTKIRYYNNTFSGLASTAYLGSYVDFGATSNGWEGRGAITGTLNASSVAFSWETEMEEQFSQWFNYDSSWAYNFIGSGTLGTEFSATNNPTITSSVSTSSVTGFLPSPASGSVRVGRTSGAKHTLLSGGRLQINASDTGNPAKFSGYSIPTASPVTCLSFNITFSNSTTTRSIWTCALGNNGVTGSTQIFSNPSALTATGSTSNPEIFNAISWEISRTSPTLINFGYRVKPQATGNASVNIINTDFFKKGQTYRMQIYCNNTNSGQQYRRNTNTYTVAARSYHIWANGKMMIYAGSGNFPANQLALDNTIDAFMITGSNSTSTPYPDPIVGDNSSVAVVNNIKLDFGTVPALLLSNEVMNSKISNISSNNIENINDFKVFASENNQLLAFITSSTSALGQINIYDASGRLLLNNNKITIEEGLTNKIVLPGTLPRGVFVAVLTLDGKKYIEKFIKQ